MVPTYALLSAITFYAIGVVLVLLALVRRKERLQKFALGSMIIGFLPHTIWLGSVCVQTHHPPLTNLPEATAFIAWTILLIQIVLSVRFKIQALSFFVYPLVLLMLVGTGLVHEQYRELDASFRSNLFTAHLFLTAVGIAGLVLGVVFTTLSYVQERSIRTKRRGALYDWIPSLQVCDVMSYRSLAIGFSLYTLGLIAGFVWAYRTNAEMGLHTKEAGAIVAWILFAGLLQSYIAGSLRPRRTLMLSAAAFISIVVAVMGIQHV
jgi:ABC-type uncharacterized transport system permease subunit